MKSYQILRGLLVVFTLVIANGCITASKPASANASAVGQQPVSADTPEGVWSQMVSHLRTGDIDGAIFYFSVASKDQYRESFHALSREELESAVSDLGSIKQSSIGENTAEYYFERPIDGQMITFPVEFDKEDGQWKIMEF